MREFFCIFGLLFLLCSAYVLVLDPKAFSRIANVAQAMPAAEPAQPAPATGDSILGAPSLSGDYINRVLQSANSPAIGTGKTLHDLSAQFNVDDAYALAVFNHESSYGKYGAAYDNHALGNIVCAGWPTCNGRFRSYVTWEDGYADFYQLLTREYIPRGLTTVESITPVYAPSSENDTPEYISSIRQAMANYRQESSA